jgi:hypothetical protein
VAHIHFALPAAVCCSDNCMPPYSQNRHLNVAGFAVFGVSVLHTDLLVIFANRGEWLITSVVSARRAFAIDQRGCSKFIGSRQLSV